MRVENEGSFPTEFSLEEFVSFQIASLVVETVFDLADQKTVFLSDERKKQLVFPNGQTKEGCLLEFYNRFAKTPQFIAGDEGKARFQASPEANSKAVESLQKKTLGFQPREAYNGIPHDLWTPLGCWNFAVSGMGWEGEVMEKLKGELGLTLYQEKYCLENMGVWVGPIYAVRQIGSGVGVIYLPEPIVRPEQECLTGEQVKALWQKLEFC